MRDGERRGGGTGGGEEEDEEERDGEGRGKKHVFIFYVTRFFALPLQSILHFSILHFLTNFFSICIFTIF